MQCGGAKWNHVQSLFETAKNVAEFQFAAYHWNTFQSYDVFVFADSVIMSNLVSLHGEGLRLHRYHYISFAMFLF